MIPEERIENLNEKKSRSGDLVLYWMQASQRSHWNHALEYAVRRANKQSMPLLVYFGLTDHYPEANLRHYRFMLEGIKDTSSALEERGIQFVMEHVDPPDGVKRIAKRASLVVVDRGYLRIQRRWRDEVARSIGCPLVQVESDVVVPVETASPKEEYTAGTFRPKIGRATDRFLSPVEEAEPERSMKRPEGDFQDPSDTDGILSGMDLDRSVAPVDEIKGGTSEALKRFHDFLNGDMKRYGAERNDPSKGIQSGMSPYLHFGQISPLFLALEAEAKGGEGVDDFLEELVVRRELSVNFVHYNADYDRYDSLPGWALKTLGEHSSDPREYVYTTEELEEGKTHDRYWNAAQTEMVRNGKMHNYMRMYWGKKILQWTEEPRKAFDSALYLNNKYSLDGRDPNSFTGVAWCFGKHDRAWKERPIFGKVRYMNANGLKRKFDIEEYAGGLLRST